MDLHLALMAQLEVTMGGHCRCSALTSDNLAVLHAVLCDLDGFYFF